MRAPGTPLVEHSAEVEVGPAAAVDATARRLTGLDLAFVAGQGALLAAHVAAARLALGWGTAAAIDAILTAYLLGLATRATWRPLVLRLMALGLAAGVCELFTDAAGERVVHSLSYPSGAPMLWYSPVYMPVSWMVTLTLLGYFGWRLRGLTRGAPVWRSMLAMGLAGAIIVPYYEEMAYRAGWWRYAPAPGLWHTPFYVALFEGLVAAALPLLVAGLERRPWGHVVTRGVALGVWMPVAALAAWLVIGR